MADLSKLESGGASGPVDQESALWKAWEAFTKSESYANSKKWAAYPDHVEGSLWNCFMVGWCAAVEKEAV